MLDCFGAALHPLIDRYAAVASGSMQFFIFLDWPVIKRSASRWNTGLRICYSVELIIARCLTSLVYVLFRIPFYILQVFFIPVCVFMQVKRENSDALGPGFRCGFLGALHMEVCMHVCMLVCMHLRMLSA